MSALADRFWAKVEKTDACWLWRGATGRSGYGNFRGRDGRMEIAHRVAYELSVGPIPTGLTLDHLCRVRQCVNPAHLEPVSGVENTRRGGNAAKTHCIHGHEFSPENTHHGRQRTCRTCLRERARRRRARVASS